MPLVPRTKFIILLALLNFSPFAFTKSKSSIKIEPERQEQLDIFFELLSGIPADYVDPSAVEEELARIELEIHYPPRDYKIVRGVEYFTAPRLLTGELDLVVQSRRTGKVIAVIELKKRYGQAARNKMNSQHNRFRNHFRAGNIIALANRSPLEPEISLAAFNGPWKSLLIGLRHYRRSRLATVTESGFQRLFVEPDLSHIHDWTLNLFRHEVGHLRARLIQFQRKLLGISSNSKGWERQKAVLDNLDLIEKRRSAFSYRCSQAFWSKQAS